MKEAAVKITSNSGLKEKYQALKAAKPETRAREAAKELQVSEGELLAARVGDDAILLENKPEEILASLKPLGQLMALTRNEDCVHERKGIYENSSFSDHGRMRMGLFVNKDIDLRLFMNHWKYSFAAIEQTKGGPKKSFQFFDKAGNAVHKIYLTPKSDEKAYDEVVKKFTALEQKNSIQVEAYDAPKPDRADNEIDTKALRTEWENLKDTHDFYPMLMKLKVGRVQAHRLVGNDFAYKVKNSSLRKTLELARDKNCEIMVFVGNKGCIQIHTGPVKKLLEHGTWFNVMDPEFNLHAREDKIFTSWVTKKPTVDGIVTGLELFDKNGELIATLFGKRKPGIPELELWREIVKELEAA